MTRTILILLGVLLANVAPVAAGVALTFHPARWAADDSALRPRSPFHVFDFQAMAFSSPGEGWIVGERFALHLRGDALEVAFFSSSDGWLTDVAVSPGGSVWMGGVGHPHDQLLSNRAGVWRDEDVAPLVGTEFVVSSLLAFPGDRVIAGISPTGIRPAPSDGGRGVAAGPVQYLEFDGTSWRRIVLPPDGSSTWHLASSCQPAVGAAWVVGHERPPLGGGVRPLVLRFDGATWTPVAAPIAGRSAMARRIHCTADGQVLLVAVTDDDWRQDPPPETQLWRYDGAWHRLDLPPQFTAASLVGPTGPVADDVWMAANTRETEGVCGVRFLHFRAGAWEVLDAPSLPARRCYTVTDLFLGAAGEGWAMGNTSDGGPLRGVILRYRDGAWRVANWDWDLWDQPLTSILFD